MNKALVWLLAALWVCPILLYVYMHEGKDAFVFALVAFAIMGAWAAAVTFRGMLSSDHLDFREPSEKLALSSMALIAVVWSALLIAPPVHDPLLIATINMVMPLGIFMHFVFWITARRRNRQ